MSGCLFCRIVAGDIPAAVVLENDAVVAFLDIGPLADGHILVVPRKHFDLLVDVPPETCSAVASVVPVLGRALLDVTQADGFNLLVNNGRAAGQEVMHVHWHLIPRSSGDGLGYRWNAGSYPPGKADELKDRYLASLGSSKD